MNNELILLQKMIDFTIWMTNHTGKFPKNHRFSYGNKIENLMIEILSDIHISNHIKNRIPIIEKIDKNLQFLKILIRLSKEMHFINLKSYEFSSKSLDEIGRILGGYKKRFEIQKGNLAK